MPAKINTVINETFIFNMDICIFSRHAEGQEDTILSYEPVIRQESKYSECNIFLQGYNWVVHYQFPVSLWPLILVFTAHMPTHTIFQRLCFLD